MLLTATPVQNNLIEIFNLVSILRPGHLGDYESFIQTFGKDRKQLKEDHYLKQLIQKVMIRNTRKGTEIEQTKRHIQTIWIHFTPEEKEVYQNLEQSDHMWKAFSKITLLREICSSREACYLSLKND